MLVLILRKAAEAARMAQEAVHGVGQKNRQSGGNIRQENGPADRGIVSQQALFGNCKQPRRSRLLPLFAETAYLPIA
jgi:hypothetical protein